MSFSSSSAAKKSSGSASRKPQRVRVTNKALESRQFSTVRMPRGGDALQAPKANVDSLYRDVQRTTTSGSGGGHGESKGERGDGQQLPQQHTRGPASSSSSASPSASHSGKLPSSSAANRAASGAFFEFDPIPNDPMFVIVEQSQYWPPPTLQELEEQTGVSVVGTDGFDAYDRREDDKKARQERVKRVPGELHHPRGKPRQNVIVQFDDDDDDEEKKDGSANHNKNESGGPVSSEEEDKGVGASTSEDDEGSASDSEN